MKKIISALLSVVMLAEIVFTAPDRSFFKGISAGAEESFSISDIKNATGIPASSVKNNYNIKIGISSGVISMSWDKNPDAFYYEIGVYQPSLGDKWGECWNISTVADENLYYYIKGKKLFSDMSKIDFSKDFYMLTVLRMSNTSFSFINLNTNEIDNAAVFWVTAYDEYNKVLGQSRLKVSDISKYEDDRCFAPADFKTTRSKSKIKLTWGEVSGADAYSVYIYDANTKKYKKYKSVKNEKCTISGLKAGTTYKFKVVSLKKVDGKYKKASDYSKVIKVKTKSK